VPPSNVLSKRIIAEFIRYSPYSQTHAVLNSEIDRLRVNIFEVKPISINQENAILRVRGFGNKVRMKAAPRKTKPPWGEKRVKIPA
jgi:hypothetical protein